LRNKRLNIEYFDSKNFKLLLEKEFHMRDYNNNTILMYLCEYNPYLFEYDIFETVFKKQCGQ